MTGPFIRLTGAVTGGDFYVNVAWVRDFGPDPDGGSWLSMDAERVLHVTASFEEIALLTRAEATS